MRRPVESGGIADELDDAAGRLTPFRWRVEEAATEARFFHVGALARRQIEFRRGVRWQIECKDTVLRRCVDGKVERGAAVEGADFDNFLTRPRRGRSACQHRELPQTDIAGVLLRLDD